MPLTVGSRLGAYEIIAPLGAGGMGEVFRARDTKLNRDVALKVLPAAFRPDVDRLARCKREAHVLAALNHPHIAQIYGFEDSGATHALVMELVEGQTLAEKIRQGSRLRANGSGTGAQGSMPSAISHREGFRLTRPSRSPGRSQRPLKPPTRRASSIAI